MKKNLKVGEKLTKSQQRLIYGGGDNNTPGPYCVEGRNDPSDCVNLDPPAPYWIEDTYQCCDRLPLD